MGHPDINSNTNVTVQKLATKNGDFLGNLKDELPEKTLTAIVCKDSTNNN